MAKKTEEKIETEAKKVSDFDFQNLTNGTFYFYIQ